MTEIVMIHSVLGLRQGLVDLADRWRENGHTVHLPDVFDGRTFDDYDPAFAYVDQIGGLPTLTARTDAALDGLPAEVVYAGLSMGAVLLSHAVATRPGAQGALVMHGGVPISAVGGDVWPSTVPVQLHEAELDPYRKPDEVEQFAESVSSSGARYTSYSYPGVSGHLFTDASLPHEYDRDATELLNQRVLSFLDELA